LAWSIGKSYRFVILSSQQNPLDNSLPRHRFPEWGWPIPNQ
jgi:hypothetical protein